MLLPAPPPRRAERRNASTNRCQLKTCIPHQGLQGNNAPKAFPSANPRICPLSIPQPTLAPQEEKMPFLLPAEPQISGEGGSAARLVNRIEALQCCWDRLAYENVHARATLRLPDGFWGHKSSAVPFTFLIPYLLCPQSFKATAKQHPCVVPRCFPGTKKEGKHKTTPNIKSPPPRKPRGPTLSAHGQISGCKMSHLASK